MDFDRENFIKISIIVVETIPELLRKYFVKKWNEKFPKIEWERGNKNCGKKLVDEINAMNKNKPMKRKEEKKLLGGNEMEWDTTALMYLLEYSNLNLVNKQEKRKLDKLREFRNGSFAHAVTMKCPSDVFIEKTNRIKEVVMDIFGESAKRHVDEVLKSDIKNKSSTELKQCLEKEEIRHKEHLADMTGKYS